jgi:hypothetical protein
MPCGFPEPERLVASAMKDPANISVLRSLGRNQAVPTQQGHKKATARFTWASINAPIEAIPKSAQFKIAQGVNDFRWPPPTSNQGNVPSYRFLKNSHRAEFSDGQMK